MKTEVIAAIDDRPRHSQTAAAERAVSLLQAGEVVALPTETVYGLAADALKPKAVVKIFEAKERPRFDPLIVHLPDRSWIERVTEVSTQDMRLVSVLIDAFWPGPFTLVLPKRSIVPDIVTAGLDTVAVRISANPVFAEIIRAFGGPLAAPSANRFGRISPTSAAHVLEELGGRIPLIVDGGQTIYGLESTVVAISGGELEILRPGPVAEEDLRAIAAGYRPAVDATTTRGIGFQPMNPHEAILIRQGGNLPHWTQTGATYSVIFRLADALPGEVVAEWERERSDIASNAKKQGRALTEAESQRLAKLFSEKVERHLDAGRGECWLRDEHIAMMMRDALLYFDGTRYELIAWCVMPNHVHVIVHPASGFMLSQILHSWKSFTGQKANQLLQREGEFWQPESYDHLIRDEQDLMNQVQYVLGNPAKAGLHNWPWVSGPVNHRQDADATIVRAPGQLPSHYAPKTPIHLIADARSFSPVAKQRVGLLAWSPVVANNKFAAIRSLSETQNLRDAAANLFRYLRELDQAGLDLIIAEQVPNQGLGVAINDRLRRASGASGVAR